MSKNPENNDEDSFANQRKGLIEALRGEGFSQPILHAFGQVKRELFIPPALRKYAYTNQALSIGQNQTISQPSTIAIMLERLELKPGLRVLEVGSGSGYVLALLSEIVGKEGKVFGVELEEKLVEQARQSLMENGSFLPEIRVGDGNQGWKEKSPFDRILVSAAASFIPKALFEQLTEKGICVAPTGDPTFQVLTILKKIDGKPFKKEWINEYFTFVPLRGKRLDGL